MSRKEKYTRRELLEMGTLAISASCFAPITSFSNMVKGSQKHLVLIHLKGGNDALNTVIPYSNSLYYKNRQKLAIDGNSVFKLNGEYGLHPSLKELVPIFKSGDLAFTLGVGYPGSSMSHEHSTNVWNSGEIDGNEFKQWFDFDSNSNRKRVESLFYRKHYSFDSLLTDFRDRSDRGIKVSHIELDGYDTHNFQLDIHSNKLKQLASGLDKLYGLESFSDTLVFVYSEFGRSITPNEDDGTDHGEGGLAMLMGTNISGGIYGDYGDLSNNSDSITMKVDFRRIQKSLRRNWIDNSKAEIYIDYFES